MNLEMNPSFKQKSLEEVGDVTTYTDSLSLINNEREKYVRQIESLEAQNTPENNLTLKGYKFKLKELDDMEKEIRESMENK